MAVYDGIAPIYDETRGPEAAPLATVVVDWLGPTGMSVLDVGVGTGLTVPLIEAARHAVIGVDVSNEMLLRARRRCPGASLARADAVCLPVRTACIDRAIALQLFQLVPDPAFLLAEIARVLRLGGEQLAAPNAVAEPGDPIGRTYWHGSKA